MAWRTGAKRACGAALLVALTAIGCSSGTDDQDATSGDEADALRSSCRHYAAFFRDRSCPVVRGSRGRWEPVALDGVPEGVQTESCRYDWVGSGRPDTKALLQGTRDAETGMRIGAVAPQCGASEPAVVDPTTDDEDPPRIHANVGSVGCDVCGAVSKGKGFIVLPPEMPGGRTFPVDLTNGTIRHFILPPSKVGPMILNLPAPPPGTAYRDGPIHLQ